MYRHFGLQSITEFSVADLSLFMPLMNTENPDYYSNPPKQC